MVKVVDEVHALNRLELAINLKIANLSILYDSDII